MGCDFHHCNKVKNNNKIMDPRHHLRTSGSNSLVKKSESTIKHCFEFVNNYIETVWEFIIRKPCSHIYFSI